jgi:hypothetical protein
MPLYRGGKKDMCLSLTEYDIRLLKKVFATGVSISGLAKNCDQILHNFKKSLKRRGFHWSSADAGEPKPNQQCPG